MAGIFDIILGPVADVVKDVIDKQVVDKNAAAAAKAEIDKQLVLAAINQQKAQTDIDLEEAKSTSVWNSGWRPGIGWMCGAAYFSNYIIAPFFSFGSAIVYHVSGTPFPAYPTLDLTTMAPVLLGLLGLGAYRTIDNYAKGTASGGA
jgi:hypothetical protein